MIKEKYGDRISGCPVRGIKLISSTNQNCDWISIISTKGEAEASWSLWLKPIE